MAFGYPVKTLQRASYTLVFVLTIVWVFASLGGLKLKPLVDSKGAVNTGGIFNWHPILMVLTYTVLMSEGILAYKYPIVTSWKRYRYFNAL